MAYRQFPRPSPLPRRRGYARLVWRVRERVCYAVAAPVSEGERRLLTTGEVYT